MDPQHQAAAAAMWDGGEYDRLAERLAPASIVLAERVAAAPRGRALELAAGTGNLAATLARSGRSTDAIDLAPGLVAIGRGRTERRGLDVHWRVGSFDDLDTLGVPEGAYTAAVSSFGLIFAPDPEETLLGVVRRLKPGGMLALTAWEGAGYIASMTRTMTELMPEPGRSAARAWIRWGEEVPVSTWLAAAGLGPARIERHRLPWVFPSAREAVAFLFTASPGHVAALHASGEHGARLRQSVLDHLVEFAGLRDPEDPVDLALDYLVALAHRP